MIAGMRQGRMDDMWAKIKSIFVLLYYCVGVVGLVMLAGLACLMVWYGYIFWSGDKHITDPARYQKCMRDFSGDVVSHFPKTIPIPLDPTLVRFDYYCGGFGQGGGQTAELWLKLDPAEIARLYAEYAEKKETHISSDLYLHILSQLPVTSATTAMATPGGAPASRGARPVNDFTIFTLDSMDPHDRWTRGVAINRKRSEIIYFAHYYYAM
jgi:hypothetical protein